MCRTRILFLFLVSPSIALADPAKHNAPPEGFVALFNGKDLDGWRGMPHFNPYDWEALKPDKKTELQNQWNEDMKAHWRVENGELINDGQGVYLTSERDFGDIELIIDWKMTEKADSGIYLRAVPQVQIWDTTEAGGKWPLGARYGSGSLWNNASKGKNALFLADNPIGEWNRFHITMVGSEVTIKLNDKLVVDHVPLENFWDKNRDLPARGPIQLQTHGGEIRWRNIFVKELSESKK